MKAVVLPETFLRCVKPEDREKLKLGLTAEEFMAKGAAKNERDLQRQIVSLLRLKGIEPNVSRMDKRKTDAVGWPDITFAVGKQHDIYPNAYDGTYACAWEIKHGDGKLSTEQQQMALRLSSKPNCWRHRVIRSVDEAMAELRDMGVA